MTHPSRTAPARSLAERFALRFAFVYLSLYALCCGNSTVWEVLPRGMMLEGLAARPFQRAAQWTGQHMFHLTGAAAHLHPSAFNDRALDWIAALIMLVAAFAAVLVWTALDRGRRDDRTLFDWLRFLLRLSLAVGMFVYGAMKLFPFQAEPLSLAVLNEHVGNLSPLSLLWAMLGYSPLYERLCGAVEVFAALLLLWRRTALAGVLATIVVMVNVVLFDCFFDVPVKLYATMLLLMCFLLLLPDARALWRFFITHQPAIADAAWAPVTRGRTRYVLLAAELLTLIYGIVTLPLLDHAKYARMAANAAHPAPFAGQWHLDSATLAGQPRPMLTGEGQPVTDIFLEPNGRVILRAADNTLWAGAHYDATQHTVGIMSPGRLPMPYTLAQPDATHLVLTPQIANEPTLSLTRVPLPSTYPLYDRGFHFINEWGFER